LGTANELLMAGNLPAVWNLALTGLASGETRRFGDGLELLYDIWSGTIPNRLFLSSSRASSILIYRLCSKMRLKVSINLP
jgi:hypothetical protein